MGTSHSFPALVATRAPPCAAAAAASTRPRPSTRIFLAVPVQASQMRTLPSWPPVATRRASPSNATPRTAPAWPRSVVRRAPVRAAARAELAQQRGGDDACEGRLGGATARSPRRRGALLPMPASPVTPKSRAPRGSSSQARTRSMTQVRVPATCFSRSSLRSTEKFWASMRTAGGRARSPVMLLAHHAFPRRSTLQRPQQGPQSPCQHVNTALPSRSRPRPRPPGWARRPCRPWVGGTSRRFIAFNLDTSHDPAART